MQRDWQLVKDLLEQIERDTLRDYIRQKEYIKDNYTFEVVLGHLEILCHSGIVVGGTVQRSGDGSYNYWDFRSAFITLEGHDLLDCLRDRTVWNRLKEKAKIAGVSISWEFIKLAMPIVLRELIS